MKHGKANWDDQLLYARTLNTLANLGLLGLITGFFIYLTEFRPLLISKERLAELWHLRINDFLALTSSPTGWEWIYQLGYSESICLTGLIFMSGISILCCVTIIPSLIHKKDYAYIAIVSLQVIVLVLAATGFFSVAGH